jgi:hypothetical protein
MQVICSKLAKKQKKLKISLAFTIKFMVLFMCGE